MANVQTIPVKELESIFGHYSQKMSEASEALEKARAEYEELSEEYKMLPYSGMTESEKEIRKRQLWELIGRSKVRMRSGFSQLYGIQRIGRSV